VTAAQVVGYCLTAFGIGYAAGALLRMGRRAIEVLE
jgi:hypothetical protein